MSLGERIYGLRTAKNLSQDLLAEMLNVSRQSVSKWENNNTVPDLDKLLKLSEIFEVSLDELVKGEEKAEGRKEEPKLETPQAAVQKSISLPLSKIAKIAGIISVILLGIACVRTLHWFLLGGGQIWGALWGIRYSLKYWIGGGICLLIEKKEDEIAEILKRVNISCR